MQDWNPSRQRNQQSSSHNLLQQTDAQTKRVESRPGRLAWWYRLTTPEEPSAASSLAEREKARRTRLSSVLLLLLSIVWLIAIPVYLITLSSNPATIPVAVVGVLVIALLLLLNRKGWVWAVAWLFIGLIFLEVMRSLSQQGHLDSGDAAIFDLLVYADLLAVSLLPSLSVFPVALTNCALIVAAFFLLTPSSPDAATQEAFVSNLLVEPVTLQIFVAVVTYLWVRSTERALARADQAELIASLEHQAAEERHQVAADSQHLLETLTRFASGDSDARVTLSQDRRLWQVGMVLNTFLARTQNAEYLSRVVQHTQIDVETVAAALRDAKAGRPPRLQVPNGSLLEPIVRELTAPRSRSAPNNQAPKPPWESGGGSGSSPQWKPTEE
ncbi:MAG TPA: hypothetical protein VH540_22945 [Ktedonobacterales bacterium]|jgi:hypothetical protein